MHIFEPFFQELYRRAGASVEFQVMPRMRELQAADSGLTDGTALCTPEAVSQYPGLVLVPTPLARVSLRTFSLDPAVKVAGPQDLGRYEVAVLRGEVISVALSSRAAKRTYQANCYENLFRMLERGRVDTVLASEVGGRYVVARMGLKGVIESPVILDSSIHHAVNRRVAQGLVPRLDKAMAQMLKDGTAKRLLPCLVQ